jgi:hypothetical protein
VRAFPRFCAALAALVTSLAWTSLSAQDAPSETPVAPSETPAPRDVPSGPNQDAELTRPSAPPGSTSEAPPSGERMRLIVVDAATFGIDPVVGRVATARLRRTGEEMGYQVLAPEETVAAAQQLRMPYPPTPADLWRVSWVARAQRGAFARIWAHGGQYVIEITVASVDGAGPFFARGQAGADDLRDVVDSLLRTALPPPESWNPAGVVAPGTERPVRSERESRDEDEPIDELDVASQPPPRRPATPEAELRRWQVTLQTEGAIGTSQDVFYNHLAGVRLDFRITRDILVGVYVAYANLNGRDGRADNMLFMGQFENRIRISPDLDLTIPLRAAAGYLPFNGPVIRLAAGLNYALSPNWEIGADILTPTFWVLPDRTAVSLNLAIEVTHRF